MTVVLRVIHCRHSDACHIAHWLGLDTQASPYYNAWSGIVPVILALVAIFLVIRSIRLEHKALRLEMQLIRSQLGADVIEGDNEMKLVSKIITWIKMPANQTKIHRTVTSLLALWAILSGTGNS